jgi:ABC-type transport system involved in multi-copper enzyme maturation permease subunit
MRQVLALAALTVKELIRRRVFYVLGLFAAGMVLLSLALVQLSIGQWGRLLTDVGLGTANLVLDLLAAILGAAVLASDIERRSIYVVIATPVARWVIVAGRFVGLLMVLLMVLVSMAIGVGLLLVLVAGDRPNLGFYQAWLGIGLECASVAALAILFSSFSSSLLAGIFAVSFVAIGHLTWNLDFFAQRSDSAVTRGIGHAISVALPNLEQFNFKSAASYRLVVERGVVRLAVLSAAAYSAFYLWLAGVSFSRRDLK